MINKITCLPDLISLNLARKGHRITKSRLNFIDFIINNKNDFFTLEDYKNVFEKVNVATFYNNITLLMECDIIGKLKEENETKYFLKSKTNIIVICNNCSNETLEKNCKIPSFEIDNIVQYDCKIFVSKCKKCLL